MGVRSQAPDPGLSPGIPAHREKNMMNPMWPSSSFNNSPCAAIFLSTPQTLLLSSCCFFLFCPQTLQYVHGHALIHINAHVGGALCINSEEHIQCERHRGRVLPTGLGFPSSPGWTPQNRRLEPQVVKLFGCEPSLSRHAVTPFPTRTNTKRSVPQSHLLG